MAPKNDKQNDKQATLPVVDTLIVPRASVESVTFRPLIEDRIKNIAARMAERGYDKAHPIPCFRGPSGKLRAYGGAHRHRAADKAGIADVYVVVTVLDHEPTPAEMLRAAIADNDHEGNGEALGRMALSYLAAYPTGSGVKLPKPDELAAELHCSVTYATKFLSAHRRASKALLAHYLDNSAMTWKQFEDVYSKCEKPEQNDRVSRKDFSFAKPYTPPLRGDAAHLVSFVASYLNEDGKLLFDALVGPNATKAAEATAELLKRAKEYYDAADTACGEAVET